MTHRNTKFRMCQKSEIIQSDLHLSLYWSDTCIHECSLYKEVQLPPRACMTVLEMSGLRGWQVIPYRFGWQSKAKYNDMTESTDRKGIQTQVYKVAQDT